MDPMGDRLDLALLPRPVLAFLRTTAEGWALGRSGNWGFAGFVWIVGGRLWGWWASMVGCVSVNPDGLWCLLPGAQHGGGGSAAVLPDERSSGACEPAYHYFLDQLLLPETHVVRCQIGERAEDRG